MNHNYTVENFGVKLRPVAMSDAEFIYQLRRDPNLSKYIGSIDARLSVHKSWMRDYFHRGGDYYFCIELLSGKIVGTIGLYNVSGTEAEWGRWVITPSIPAAPASAWLIYHFAFDVLGLSQVSCRTVVENMHVVSFHDHCGLLRDGIERAGLIINGEPKDLVIHTAAREHWPAIQKKLETSAAVAQRFIEGVTIHDKG